MAQAVIETRGLTKRYGELPAAAGLEPAVYPGEVFGFLGPNAAGKTTTVRMLTTLTRPRGGRAWLSGRDVVREPVAAKRGMGVVSQHLLMSSNDFNAYFGGFVAAVKAAGGRPPRACRGDASDPRGWTGTPPPG